MALMLTASGCDEDKHKRLAEMAERHLERQAEQNRQVTKLQHEVMEGGRHLVEADAQARHELVALQRELQAERSDVGKQRDLLERARSDLAAQRRLDPIIASAITNVALLLVCLWPLALCWRLLNRRLEIADDSAIAEVLLEDLVRDQPLLLPPATVGAIGQRDDGGAPELSDDAERPNEPT